MVKSLPLLAVLLVLISCVIPLGPATSGQLVFKLPGSRVAVEPAANDFSLVTQWRIEGQGPGGALVDVETSAASNTITVTGLVVGDWQFKVSGKDAANKVLYQQTATMPIAAGHNMLSLTLVKVEDPVEPVVFAGGDGTAADPYQVADYAQLNEVRNHLTSHFLQIADISLAGFEWVPIGTQTSPFLGSYTGISGGVRKTLSSLSINLPSDSDLGLFGYLGSGAQVYDVSLTNVNIKGSDRVGALAGTLDNGASVHRSFSTGKVEGSSDVGGLVGHQNGGLIEISFSTAAALAGNNNAGGLVGAIVAATGASAILSDVFAVGGVSAAGPAGGLVGSGVVSGGSLTIQRSYASGTVAGGTPGGLLGVAGGSILFDNDYYDADKNGLTTPTSGETPKTSLQMSQQATYAGWPFGGTWTIDGNVSTPYFPWMSPSMQPSAFFMGGQGGLDSPWQVATASQLNAVRNFLGAHFVQTATINLNGYGAGLGWEPIGYNGGAFAGSYDGGGFSIDNLKIDRTSSGNPIDLEREVGLFGYVSPSAESAAMTDGILKNIHLVNVDITSGTYAAGSLIGTLSDTGTYASVDKPVVLNCSAAGVIDGAAGYAGGLIGSAHSGNIVQIVTISNSSADVAVSSTADGYFGGLIGEMQSVRVYRCWSSGDVTAGAASSVGGVGGLIGWINYTSPGLVAVEQSLFSGNVTGATNVGGLIGRSMGISGRQVLITDCYAWAGQVEATTSTAGGLIGNAEYTTVDTSWSGLVVTTPATGGGLVGYALTSTSVNNSYYDSASGQADNGYGTEAATADLQSHFFFDTTSFNFATVWSLEDGNYPVLQWQK